MPEPRTPSRRPGSSRPWLLLTLVAAVAMAASACGGGSGPAPRAPGPSGEISVFAASSLTDAFKEMGASFAKANPGTKVAFNFASSSALVAQINEGAPADVFAAADNASMQAVAGRGAIDDPAVFAENTPVVVVPKGGGPVQSFADLAKPAVKLVLAGKDAPIGKYARNILANASAATGGIDASFEAKALTNLRSEEANARAVLSKVQLGEADAGIVYQTDVAAAGGEVKQLAIPAQYNVVAQYPIAAVKASKNIVTARAFVLYVRSQAGQAVLAKYGFGAPR